MNWRNTTGVYCRFLRGGGGFGKGGSVKVQYEAFTAGIYSVRFDSESKSRSRQPGASAEKGENRDDPPAPWLSEGSAKTEPFILNDTTPRL